MRDYLRTLAKWAARYELRDGSRRRDDVNLRLVSPADPTERALLTAMERSPDRRQFIRRLAGAAAIGVVDQRELLERLQPRRSFASIDLGSTIVMQSSMDGVHWSDVNATSRRSLAMFYRYTRFVREDGRIYTRDIEIVTREIFPE
jgi:hypothetical protein